MNIKIPSNTTRLTESNYELLQDLVTASMDAIGRDLDWEQLSNSGAIALSAEFSRLNKIRQQLALNEMLLDEGEE
jgi:hypothetical protein|tara:strand:+ start:352 stop:576 length:225 start_codon:yes stop_codon:yes gene_type:complete